MLTTLTRTLQVYRPSQSIMRLYPASQSSIRVSPHFQSFFSGTSAVFSDKQDADQPKEQEETKDQTETIQQLQTQLKELKDQYLRALADSENLSTLLIHG